MLSSFERNFFSKAANLFVSYYAIITTKEK